MMTELERDTLLNILKAKYGDKVFSFTDLQREMATLNGIDYDQRDANGARVHRGFYANLISDVDSILYQRSDTCLQLKRISRGQYQVTGQSVFKKDDSTKLSPESEDLTIESIVNAANAAKDKVIAELVHKALCLGYIFICRDGIIDMALDIDECLGNAYITFDGDFDEFIDNGSLSSFDDIVSRFSDDMTIRLVSPKELESLRVRWNKYCKTDEKTAVNTSKITSEDLNKLINLVSKLDAESLIGAIKTVFLFGDKNKGANSKSK